MAAPVFYIERDLFVNPANWISNKGDSINKPPADYFEASNTPDYGVMMITNGSLQAWGGALVSRKRSVPANNGKLLNWLAFGLEFQFPSSTVQNIARLETDLKVCVKTRPDANTKIRNVANFSTQWNADTGQFQIDLDPPAWVNSGFVVPNISPDEWHKLEYRFWFDEVNTVFSVLSIQLDERLYMIPNNLQNVSMSLTNWEQVSSLQLQNEIYSARSTGLVEYRNGVLAWSDQRITEIPQPPTREAEFWLPRTGREDLLGGDFDIFGDDVTPLGHMMEEEN